MVEVLVAAVVLSVGMVETLNAIAACSASVRGVQDRNRALMFARSKMDEVLKAPTLQLGTDQGQGVDQSTDYDWQVNVTQSNNPGLYLVQLTVTNRVTKKSIAPLFALRRPDLATPSSNTDTSTDLSTDQSSTGGGT